MQALVHNGLNTHTRAAHKAMTYQLAVRAFSGYAFCVLLSFVMLNATRAGVLYVGTAGGNVAPYATPAEAATNLSDAVALARDGDEVRVAAGDYAVSNILTLTNAVRLLSIEGPGAARIKALCSHGALLVNHTNALVDGFDIDGGEDAIRHMDNLAPIDCNRGTIYRCRISGFYLSYTGFYGTDNSGSVVACGPGGTLIKCRIEQNRCTGYAGAAALRSQGGQIIGAEVVSNVMGVAVECFNGVFRNGLISHNIASGAALHYDARMESCIVSDNTPPPSTDDIIRLHPYSGTGGVYNDDSSCMRNCLVRGNIASLCGGVSLKGDRTEMVNCTLADNRATQEDAPSDLWGRGEVWNSVVAVGGTNAAQVRYLVWQDAIRHALLIPEMWPGRGIASGAELFKDPAHGNFRPKTGGLAVNAGTNQPWMASCVDLDGHPRVVAGRVDLGAWETEGQEP